MEIAWESGPVNHCCFALLPPATAAPAAGQHQGSSPGTWEPQALLLTCHVQQQRREGRILLWDVVQRRWGWVDGKLCGPVAALDGFRGKVTSADSCCPSALAEAIGGSPAAWEVAPGADEDGAAAALLAAACTDGSVRVYDLAALAAAPAGGPASKAAAAPLLELLLPDAAQAGAELPAWSALSMQAAAHERNLASLSPDGRLLAAVGPDRRILVHELESGSEQQPLALTAPDWRASGMSAVGGAIRVLRWLAPDRLLSAGEDGRARIWDVSTAAA
jgi:WD40 repeat protein